MLARGALGTACWLVAAVVCCTACDTSVDASYKTNLVNVVEMRAERIASDEPSLFFVDAVLENRTQNTVNNVSGATLVAGETSANFDFWDLDDPHAPGPCPDPEPWDVPPKLTKAVRLRVDVREDVAQLLLACKFDAQMLGFDYRDTRTYTAPRIGPALANDFFGPFRLEFRATMDASCTPDDCPWHALAKGSGEIALPP